MSIDESVNSEALTGELISATRQRVFSCENQVWVERGDGEEVYCQDMS